MNAKDARFIPCLSLESSFFCSRQALSSSFPSEVLMTPTQQIRQRPRNDAEDAMILVWLLLLAIAGVVYYLAYARFHLRPNQLVELTLYPVLVAYFIYECLRYAATRKSKLEEAWPRPIPHISPAEDRKQLERAREQDAVLLGHDIYG